MLILSLRINKNDVSYYKNIINYIKLKYYMDIYIVVVVNTDFEFNNDLKFYENEKYIRFGINDDTVDEYYFDLIYDKIIFCPNKGYDVGSFLVGLKYIENMQFKFFIKLHSKTNNEWRKIIFNICNYNIVNTNYDTIVAKLFTQLCDENDLNFKILLDYPKLFSLNNKKKWKYVQGTTYISRIKYLSALLTNFNDIYILLTDIYKNDVYWIDIMKNDNLFKKYCVMYENNIYNLPINANSQKKLIETNSKNYLELFKHDKCRGIPDVQFEHAIERYLGLLLINDNTYYV